MAPATWRFEDLGGTVGTLHAGAKLRVAYWREDAAGPGTVILVEGRTEPIEFYGETIADLRHRGFSVVAFDLRGQGASQRRTRRGGHVDSFRQYVDDLVAVTRFARELGLPKPFTVLAHSMGGLVALEAQPALARDVSRMVLTAPMLQIARLPMPRPFARLVVEAASLFGLGQSLVFSPLPPPTMAGFEGNPLTSDRQRYGRLCDIVAANPELAPAPPTFGWMRAAMGTMAKAMRRREKPLHMPTLFVGSGADRIVSTAAIDRFARAAPGGGMVLIRDARHQVLFERDELRNLFLAAFDAFVTDQPHEAGAAKAARAPRRMMKFVVASQADPAVGLDIGAGRRVAAPATEPAIGPATGATTLAAPKPLDAVAAAPGVDLTMVPERSSSAARAAPEPAAGTATDAPASEPAAPEVIATRAEKPSAARRSERIVPARNGPAPHGDGKEAAAPVDTKHAVRREPGLGTAARARRTAERKRGGLDAVSPAATATAGARGRVWADDDAEFAASREGADQASNRATSEDGRPEGWLGEAENDTDILLGGHAGRASGAPVDDASALEDFVGGSTAGTVAPGGDRLRRRLQRRGGAPRADHPAEPADAGEGDAATGGIVSGSHGEGRFAAADRPAPGSRDRWREPTGARDMVRNLDVRPGAEERLPGAPETGTGEEPDGLPPQEPGGTGTLGPAARPSPNARSGFRGRFGRSRPGRR